MDKTYPTLYGLSSSGKVKQWDIEVKERLDGTSTITVEAGYVDGKKAVSIRIISAGKNVGKKNETSPNRQAISKAQSKWTKKCDKNYSTDINYLLANQPVHLRPMLAHTYDKRKHNIEWPAYVQPKLDGVRCLAKRQGDTISYLSRGSKEFTTLQHLTPRLLDVMEDGDIFDGEIFTRQLTFQQIVSAVKKKKDNTALLQYWLYDIANSDMSFINRTSRLDIALWPDDRMLIRVPTASVMDEKGMMTLHKKFVQKGYEGTIVRNIHGKYLFDHRSADLQKFKDFIDAEAYIIGYKEATGNDVGTIVFICKTTDGKVFECRPRGTREQRRKWFDDGDLLIGKQLTYRYFDKTDDGIPRFPVGLIIRGL